MNQRLPRPAAPEGPREVAAAALARVLDDKAWAQPTLSAALDASAMTERDKALATELFYGALRFAGPLEASLLRAASKPGRGLDVKIRPHLLVAAYQLQHLSDRIPAHAAVSAGVSAVKRVRPGLDGFANALLRHLGSPLHALLKPTASLKEVADAWGVPMHLARAVTAGHPVDEQQAIVAGLCARPSTWAVFFGDTPTQVDGDAEGLTPHAFVPRTFALGAGRVSAQPGFVDGGFLVMDPGSALCALAATPKAGDLVLDLCAAPGGKSMLLADAVGKDGRVVAVEKNQRRSERITDNSKRLNLRARVEVVVGDVGNLDGPLAEQGAPLDGYDVVLLDAPCSGLGTTRRKPEVKLNRSADDVAANVALQQLLLKSAATRVKPGGVLVYSVCSPMPEEGSAQIDAFLAANDAYVRERLDDVLPYLPKDSVDGHGQLRLLPNKHDADAFFIARLRRR